MLKIGITPCFFYPDPNRDAYSKKSLTYVEIDLVNYLAGPDIMPILIPDIKGKALIGFLSELDGIVFQGGNDVAPKSYGDEMIEDGRWPGDYYRDQFELEVMDFAFFNKIPVLGVCRGHQLLNVYFKGKLYQDIALETGTSIVHREGLAYDEIYHEVEFHPDSILNKIYPKGPFVINSVHHQGIKILGPDLVAEAFCPQDKVIEAFRYKDLKEQFVYSVQWHPEFSHTLGDKILDPVPLLDYFIENVLKRRK
jgi:putative glutamine amidotransferase